MKCRESLGEGKWRRGKGNWQNETLGGKELEIKKERREKGDRMTEEKIKEGERERTEREEIKKENENGKREEKGEKPGKPVES